MRIAGYEFGFIWTWAPSTWFWCWIEGEEFMGVTGRNFKSIGLGPLSVTVTSPMPSPAPEKYRALGETYDRSLVEDNTEEKKP